jgi:Response regulator containing a CheY-like receiver domain and an HTH DNA-binding domain
MIKALKNFSSNITKSSTEAAVCTGGYIGWYLSVKFICEKSLEIYGTSSFYDVTNIIFGLSMTAVLGVMLMLMFHLDFEGLLGHRYFRVVPAILMAESGIALAFTNADSFGIYSVITGICASFGALAVFSRLLSVRVSHRLFSVALGTAIGGLVRYIDHVIYSYMDMTRGLYALAVLSGLLALMTVRSSGFSKEQMPIISYSEASHKILLQNIPGAYALLFALAGIYYLCLGRITTLGMEMYVPFFRMYGLYTYISYVAAAVIIAVFVRFHNVTPLYVYGVCFMSFTAIMLLLPYFSRAEETVFLISSFAGQACFAVFVYIFIVTFAMDRQHPMFYSIFGYACVIAARSAADLFNHLLPVLTGGAIITLTAILLIIGGPAAYSLLKKYGLTQESFEHHRALRELIIRKSEQMQLSDREKYILDLVVLGGYTMEQLPDKMMLSRNTVRAQSRNLLKKLDVEELAGLRGYFETLLAGGEPAADDVTALVED